MQRFLELHQLLGIDEWEFTEGSAGSYETRVGESGAGQMVACSPNVQSISRDLGSI